MSELDRVLDERLAAFRPTEEPPFATITARRDRRRRLRSASAVGLSAVAVAGVTVLGPQLLGSPGKPDSLANGPKVASVAEVRAALCPFAERPLDTAEQRAAVIEDLDAALASITTFTPDATDVFDPALRLVNAPSIAPPDSGTEITVPGAPPPPSPPNAGDDLYAKSDEERRQHMVNAQADLRAACAQALIGG
jgi:hypothetical protein